MSTITGTSSSDSLNFASATFTVRAQAPVALQSKEAPTGMNSQLQKPADNTSYTYKIIDSEHKTYGYDIFKEAKIRRFWAKYPESIAADPVEAALPLPEESAIPTRFVSARIFSCAKRRSRQPVLLAFAPLGYDLEAEDVFFEGEPGADERLQRDSQARCRVAIPFPAMGQFLAVAVP